ncbi:MAG: TetR/AcrR family transcriptional regulator [Smithellaceae bacterium]|nr:TetR/AcrR family transcriptional regulator [Smithellaceae bacterium]
MEKNERRAREFHLRRKEILSHAERIFAAKGFYNTTVAEIANSSGFAVGTIYQFFEGKEHLYTTMISEGLDLMYGGIRDAVKQEKGFVARIEALVRAHLSFVENHTEFCSILMNVKNNALSSEGTSLRDRMVSDYLSNIRFIEEVISDGVTDGELMRIDERASAVALIGMIHSFTIEWLMSRTPEPLVEKLGTIMDLFLNGIGMKLKRR